MNLLRLALRSAWNRRVTLALIVCAIALSVTMLLGVERARIAAREGFSQAVSGTDLVVGARTSPIQLVLYAVFHLGEATNNMLWKSEQQIAGDPAVAWAIPISLGDSHRGFPTVGTTPAFFEHFKYSLGAPLAFSAGRPFSGLFDTVLGADVASHLGYRLGDAITLTHGSGGIGSVEHADKPFTVVGILARTGTPVDRSVFVSLEAIEAIHLGWQGGAPPPGGFSIPEQFVRKFDLTPKTITAMLVGLRNRAAVFHVQRAINEFAGEPLMAVLPGVALDQLWQVVGVVEKSLLAVSALVVVVGIAGMAAAVLASLNERRRELSILRSVGAGPRHIVALLGIEALLVTGSGAALGVALLVALSALTGPWLESNYGLPINALGWSVDESLLLAAVVAAGFAAGVLPAYRACRLALADGLTPRL
ncbi:MAG TPA: ABC transporter permease [Usitatibacter sp.]|nr:ABC transporter permease [Usitatibacter sp.]